jgi:hypothetical protein
MTGTAAGNITPMSFVTQATATDNQFNLATGTSLLLVGISGKGTRYPPYANLDDGNIAVAGENFPLYRSPHDEEAQLILGGTVTAGDELTSDGSGHGITASSTNQVGAQAMQSGVSGGIITVRLLSPGVKD